MRKHPSRILHVVGQMDRGGVETWLINVARRLEGRVRFDVLVHSREPGAYDAEVRALGGEVFYGGDPAKPWHYVSSVLSELRRRPRYDVLHSHVHHYSGLVLGIGRAAGIPVRVAHSHSDTSAQDQAGGRGRQMYLRTMEWLLQANATARVACSEAAGTCLFGEGRGRKASWSVLRCGVDLAPLGVSEILDRTALGLPADAFVVGHVGRFVPLKNHAFLIEVLQALVRQRPNAHLLLIGDGPLRNDVAAAAEAAGLADHVTFAGLRADVLRIMRDAMDAFLFPSLYEGLPVVVTEAQAAGLPTIVADTVTPEVVVAPTLVERISLEAGPEAWAGRLLELVHNVDRSVGLAAVTGSAFDLEINAHRLMCVYVSDNIDA